MGTGDSIQALEKTGRRIPRTVGVRVTEPEYLALEVEAGKAGKTVADWARQQILGRPAFHGVRTLDQYLFTELVGIQLLLMNTLGPLLRGERLTAEQLDAVLRTVQSAKARKAEELLARRLGTEERRI
jgi:mobilization protein NikA